MSRISSIARLPQTIRNIQRLREILGVVGKYGFEEVVLRLGIEGAVDQTRTFLKLRLKPSEEWGRDPVEVRIRMVIEELGPTFIKFGQILATRPDLIPMSLIQELRKLQDDVPPFSSVEAKRMVEEELGGPVSELYESFDDKPIAAASIGQVHRATVAGGERVVVKVQRPGLQRTISTDLDLLRILAELLVENVPESVQYDPRGLVEQFAQSIVKEIDFTREAFHLVKFKQNFEEVPHVHTPKVYEALSTGKVLTMEFIEGIKASDFERLDAEGYDRELLAKRGTEAVLKMIFVDGFFHADPHPGNIFVMPGNVICFIDYGMMGFIDEERIDELLVFLVALLTGDMDRMVNLFYRLDLIDDTVNVRALKGEAGALLDRYGNVSIKDVDIAVFIQEIFETIQRHNVKVPSDLMLMSKSIATMEGIAQELYPEYDPLGEMRSFLLKVYVQRLTDPKYLFKGAYRTLDAWAYLLRRVPRDAEAILAKIRRGELTARIVDPDAREHSVRSARALNRLALAVVVGAFGLSSTALLVTPLGPEVAGVPLTTAIGTVGWGATGLLALGLGIGLLRSNLE